MLGWKFRSLVRVYVITAEISVLCMVNIYAFALGILRQSFSRDHAGKLFSAETIIIRFSLARERGSLQQYTRCLRSWNTALKFIYSHFQKI